MEFKNYAIRERKLIKKLCNLSLNDLELLSVNSDEGYDFWDCSILLKDTKSIFITEIKVRDFESTKYPSAILESKKVDNILKDVEEMRIVTDKLGIELVPFYISIYKDVSIGWKITGEEDQANIFCPKTTAGNSDKVKKLVNYFMIKDGAVFNYK